MKARRLAASLIVAILGGLLVSCSATRYDAPSSKEFESVVLIIKKMPDGRATHSWQRIERSQLLPQLHRAEMHRAAGQVVLAATRQRDCHQEFNDCQDDCLSRPLASGYEHVKQGSGAHASICRKQCWQPYLDCEELQERQGLQHQGFTRMDEAIDWLKRNHETLLVGSVVVIAGVVSP